MNKLGKIKNSSTAFFLFLLCWIAYFTAYIGRLNYSSAMSDMIQTGILTQSHAGFISMLYFSPTALVSSSTAFSEIGCRLRK